MLSSQLDMNVVIDLGGEFVRGSDSGQEPAAAAICG